MCSHSIGGNHLIPMTPPPSSMFTSFDWIRLGRYHLPPYVPFLIIVQYYNMLVPITTIDEDAYVSVFSSTTWQDLGSLQLVPVTQNMLAFNRGTNQMLGILP